MITPMVREGWLFELKWDGFRAIAETNGTDGVKLYSRNQKDFRRRFPRIVDTLANLKKAHARSEETVSAKHSVRCIDNPASGLAPSYCHRVPVDPHSISTSECTSLGTVRTLEPIGFARSGMARSSPKGCTRRKTPARGRRRPYGLPGCRGGDCHPKTVVKRS